ncbi:uncharacterized protein LOC118494467 [Sander lucioperca]|uniref:uncharacterized protein LOC118494467 n=1 Tax=Sander lucioperca TaxID=283035 RepID=UPI00165375B8|nr:uncharacterized protein LOC118494467 [Sander lucioperca]
MPSFQPNHSRLNNPLQSYVRSAAQYMWGGLAKSTLKSYDLAWSYFITFCASVSVAALPVNVSYISAFIVHCFEDRKLQPSSIKSTVAGIQFHLRCLDPSASSILENPSIRLLLNGLKRQSPRGNDKRLPFTLPLVKQIISQLRNGCFGPYTGQLLETVILTAFFGFLRGGEISSRTCSFDPNHNLTISDVSINDHHFTLFLKHSKTDRNGEGVVVYISESNTVFCPLISMMTYLRCRPSAGLQEPLFVTQAGKPMSRAWFASHLRLLCQFYGLPPDRCTAHSLRIGAATTAAASAPVLTLKAMGRWSSAAYERYLRPDVRAILDAQKAMSSGP